MQISLHDFCNNSNTRRTKNKNTCMFTVHHHFVSPPPPLHKNEDVSQCTGYKEINLESLMIKADNPCKFEKELDVLIQKSFRCI